MEQRARIRVDLAQRAFEIEGSETFVRDLLDRLEDLVQNGAPVEAAAAIAEAPAASVPAAPTSELGSFGEFIQRLPSSATEVDRMLAAGYWCQAQSADDAFATGDANRRLTEQGIKLGNPSQCVRQSLNARRVFAVQRGRFRVSQTGRHYLRQLVGELVPA
ncbi:MAG: hypothetical protein U1E14_07435 [Geminicoccaceae bacterium]